MKLHQLIAKQGKVAARVTNAASVIHKASQKPALFTGVSITYEPLATNENDVSAQKPPEGNSVQLYATKELGKLRELLTELYDVNATRDWSNMVARGTVKVGDKVILSDVPVPFLLFLKLELNRLRTEFSAIPVLDPSKDWKVDTENGGYKTETTWQHSTRRVKKVLERSPATDKHQAVTEVYEEEVPVARKETTNFSGALSRVDRDALIRQVDLLFDAVTEAVEEANTVEVVDMSVGKPIFDFLLAPLTR
jgi:hypothetical protein